MDAGCVETSEEGIFGASRVHSFPNDAVCVTKKKSTFTCDLSEESNDLWLPVERKKKLACVNEQPEHLGTVGQMRVENEKDMPLFLCSKACLAERRCPCAPLDSTCWLSF